MYGWAITRHFLENLFNDEVSEQAHLEVSEGRKERNDVRCSVNKSSGPRLLGMNERTATRTFGLGLSMIFLLMLILNAVSGLTE